MAIYMVTYTDLFSGELNYSTVSRYSVKAKSFLGAIRIMSKYLGLNFRLYLNNYFAKVYHSVSKSSAVIIELFDDNESEELENYKALNY